MPKPTLSEHKFNVDDRGMIGLFDLPKDAKRFYFVGSHKAGFVRAWHGHKKEAKYAVVVKGAAFIGAVEIDDWKEPLNERVDMFVLSESKPEILYIPPGYANGFKTLTDDTRILFFSNRTIEQSVKDDFRYSARRWNMWEDIWR